MSKLRPILFSTPMVLAIRKDRKTNTRRLMKSDKPPWEPGDRLWVREGLCKGAPRDFPDTIRYTADGKYIFGDGVFPMWRWQRDRLPSIHMPKEACRTVLLVEGVHAEHLQKITLEGARAEGVGSVEEFKVLWESLHGPGSWDKDPQVWAVRFRRLGGEELRLAVEELKR